MENLKEKFVRSVESYLKKWAYEPATATNLNTIANEIQDIGINIFDVKYGKIVVPVVRYNNEDSGLEVCTEFKNITGAIEFSFVFTLKSTVTARVVRD